MSWELQSSQEEGNKAYAKILEGKQGVLWECESSQWIDLFS